ncbi:hypothetical protein EDD11_010265 [Mortierella claussenii]|nr:hypothetical protein EDD11_010265 [Mortierella claussenii]
MQQPSGNLARSSLFNVGKSPLEIPTEEFQKDRWPSVSNIWTRISGCLLQNGDITWTTYACRLSKPFKFSTRKPGFEKENCDP